MNLEKNKEAEEEAIKNALNAGEAAVAADLGNEPVARPMVEYNDLDLAAKHFMESTTQIAMTLPRASKKELQRLINALVVYPVEGYPNFKSMLERSIFNLFLSATEAKYYMISTGLEEKARRNTEAEEASLKATEVANKEENTNG